MAYGHRASDVLQPGKPLYTIKFIASRFQAGPTATYIQATAVQGAAKKSIP